MSEIIRILIAAVLTLRCLLQGKVFLIYVCPSECVGGAFRKDVCF